MGGMRRGHVPLGPLVRAVQQRSEDYDLSRQDDNTAQDYGTDPSYTVVGTLTMAVGLPTETIQQAPSGQVDTGTVTALAPTGQAVTPTPTDRVTYQADDYEVTGVTGIPETDSPVLWSIQFQRLPVG